MNEIELKEAELRATRAREAQKSLDRKVCIVCGEGLVVPGTEYDWITDDVFEGVLLADGPEHLVAEDAHFLGHYDCMSGWLRSGDAVQA